MKILCIIDSLVSGGAQRQLVELAIGFKEKGHQVSFLIYRELYFYKVHLDDAGIPITCIKESSYIKRLFKMRKFIRSGRYNVILSFLETSNFIATLSAFPHKKWKLIICERSANPVILKSLRLRFYRLFHLFADHIVANSHANIALVRKANPFICRKKCTVIYNMIDTQKWHPNDNLVVLSNSKVHVAVFARYQKAKNLTGLLEAIKGLSTEDKNKLVLNWYGNGSTIPYYDSTYTDAIALIKRYGLENIVTLNREIKHVSKIMQSSDVIGLFSFYEGFPNTVCEAMATGKPIICSKVSDIPLFFSRDSKLLFDPKDPKTITQTLHSIIRMTKKELIDEGKRNREIAIEKFSKEKIVNAYLDIIKE
jgi:glycosyltransferase involved in cell wall biosynthesis